MKIKKSVFTVLVSIFTISICYSQDMMTTRTGEDVLAKVLEVTTSEIKYKKFDNQDGPTYTILKSEVVMIRYKNGTKDIFIDKKKEEPVSIQSTISHNNKATIYFIRSTGANAMFSGFMAFIDEQLVCKLNNNRFSTHQVDPGEHVFSVQFAGKQVKEKAKPISIKVEVGKTYYIQMVILAEMWKINLLCQEVTEMSAKKIMPALSQDNDCI